MRLLLAITMIMMSIVSHAFTPVDLTTIEAKDGYGDSVYKILDSVSNNKSHCLSMVDIMELSSDAFETAKQFCEVKNYE